MTRSSQADAFLAPLSALPRRKPPVEGLVFWAADGWPEEETEILDAEEIAFYAEGLIPEGFSLEWRLVGRDGVADHLRLYVWQDGPPPPEETGREVIARARWP